MADLDIKGRVVVDATQAEGAFKKVGAAADKMSQDITDSANKAGKATDGIGAGAESSVPKFTRAGSQIRAEIQKSTAAIENFGKTASQKLELKITAKGLDRAQFAPYLAELKRVEQAQLDASGATSAWKSSLDKFGPAAAAAFSFASVAGFVGKIVSVQREFDVLNSSLKTVTGSSEAAERELSWLKTFAKETPFGLTQATQGFVKMKALGLDPTRAALTSFGNTASAMGKDLNQMIEAVADASTGEFERLKEFGIKAKKQGDEVSLTFQGVTKTIGNSAQEITKYLEDIGNAQFAGAMEERAKTLDGTIAALGDTWDELFRTVSTNNVGGFIFDTVTLANGALEDATTILKAMGDASKDAATGTGALATIQGGLATVFETVAVLGANLKYVLVGIGNEIGGLAAQVAQAAQFNFSGVAAIRTQMVEDAKAARKEIDATTERILNARKEQDRFASYATRNASAATDPRRLDNGDSASLADAEKKQYEKRLKAKKDFDKEYATQDQKAIAEIAKQRDLLGDLFTKSDEARIRDKYKNTAGNKAIKDANRELAEQAKLLAELSGLSGTFYKDWDRLSVVYKKGELSLDGLLKSQSELLDKQPAIKASRDAEAKAAKVLSDAIGVLSKAREDEYKKEAASIVSIEAKAQAIEDEIANYGLTEQAIASLGVARLQEKADLLSTFEGSERVVELLNEEITARKRLALAQDGITGKKAAAKAAADAASEWKKASDKIESSITDSLMRGFESGKGFAENLRDTVVNMFKTLILRPTIQGIVQGGLSAVGLGGLSSAASAASTGSSLLSTGITLAGSSIAAIGSSVATGFAAGWAGTSTAAASAAYSAAGMSGVATGLSAGSSVGGALAAIGPAGWAAMAVLAVAAIASGRGETRSGASYVAGADGKAVKEMGPSGGEISGDSVRGMFDATTAGINDMLKKLGSSDSVSAFVAGLESSKAGKGFVYAGGTLNTGAKFGEAGGRNGGEFAFGGQTAEEAVKGYQLQLKQATLQALSAATDIPKQITTILGSVDVTNVAEGVLDDLMGQINTFATNVNSMRAALELLPIDYLKDLSFATAAGLAEAAGGFDVIGASLGTFYDKFTTEAEKTANSTSSLEKAFAGLNIVMPAVDGNTRAWYKSEVDRLGAMDLNIAANARAYTSALSLGSAVDSLAPAFEGVSRSAADMLAALANASASAQQSIATLNGVSSSDYSAQMIRAAQDSTFAAVNAAMPWIKDLAQLKTIDLSKGGDFEKNYKASDQALIVAALAAAATVYTAKQEAATAQTYADTSYTAPDTSAADAAAQRAAEVLQEQLGLQTQLNALLDTSAQALARQRDALDESNRAIFDHINAIKVTQAAYADSKTATDAAMAAVKRAVDAAKAPLTTLRDSLKSVFTLLQDQVDQLYGSVSSTATMQAREGNAYIDAALASGTVTDSAALSKAIAAARGGLDANQYATQFEADKAALVMAGKLTQLKDIGGTQLTTAEKQLAALDDQLAVAQAQYDALNGINTSVLSVKDAIDALTAAMTKQAGAGASQLYATNSAATANPDQAGLDYWANRIKTDGYDATKPAFDASVDFVNNRNSVTGWYGSTAGASTPDQQGVEYWVQQVQDMGEASAKALFEQVVSSLNLPKLATGTNLVPNDMMAMLHEGEAVIPKAYNPASGSGNNDRLERLVEGLTAEVQRLQSIVATGNSHANRTANAVNGNPESPMLVENV